MNEPINMLDVGQMVDNLLPNRHIKLYMLDSYNKKSLSKMIKDKAQQKYKNKDFFMIMYDLSEIGHWCSLIINYVKKSAFFYCSFGVFIDNQFKYGIKKQEDNDLVRSLLRYLFRKGFEVHFNNVQLQKYTSSVCGRYCAVYISLNVDADITPDEFNELILNRCEEIDCTPDELILIMTSRI